MTEQEKQERIEALDKKRTEHWARAYEIEAEIDTLRGESLSEAFHAGLAACWRNEPGAEARKERAYVRLQASKVLRQPEIMRHIAEADRPKVAAEVERMKAERCPEPHCILSAHARDESHWNGAKGWESECSCVRGPASVVPSQSCPRHGWTPEVRHG